MEMKKVNLGKNLKKLISASLAIFIMVLSLSA